MGAPQDGGDEGPQPPEPEVPGALRAPLPPVLRQLQLATLLQRAAAGRHRADDRGRHLDLRARLLADEQPEDGATLENGEDSAAPAHDCLFSR
eukprot:3886219-Prymnesium_polylepis.1